MKFGSHQGESQSEFRNIYLQEMVNYHLNNKLNS
jgi:hypothetical protein